jgi:hypothetical protein
MGQEDEIMTPDDNGEVKITNDELGDELSGLYDKIMANEDVDVDKLESDKVDDTDSADDLSDGDEEGSTDADDGEIDPLLVARAREAGLDDETIVDLATNHEEALEKLIDKASERVVVDELDPEPEPDPEPEDNVADKDYDLPEDMDEKTKQLFETVLADRDESRRAAAKLEERLSSIEADEQERMKETQRQLIQQIDGFFDEKADDFPELGKTETLTVQEDERRQEIFRMAEVLSGKTLDEKLEKATKAYRGLYNDPEESLRKKLYKQKEQFSPRPSGKKQSEKLKTDQDRAMAAMEEVAREHNLDLT